MGLCEEMHEIEVLINFNVHNPSDDRGAAWCDQLELFIHYDIREKGQE